MASKGFFDVALGFLSFKLYETDHLVFSRDPLTTTLRNSKVSGTVVKSGSIDETPEIGRIKIQTPELLRVL